MEKQEETILDLDNFLKDTKDEPITKYCVMDNTIGMDMTEEQKQELYRNMMELNRQKAEKKSGGIIEYIRKRHPFNPDWDKEEPETETSEAGRS